MVIHSKRGRRRQRRAFLLGAAAVLAAESVLVSALLLPSVHAGGAVEGTAHPVAIPLTRSEPAAAPGVPPPPPPAAQPPAAPPPPRPAQAARPARPDQPVRGQRPGTIRLPAGGTAQLVRKEVGPDAVLPVPDDLGEATWWGAGLAAPSGASVFAGHVNWGGRTGPFAELWNARIADEVTVVDDAGKAWRYRVSQLITLHKDELPQRADELFGQRGPHRIVLVTCGGRWLGGSTGYAENRVVVADPVA
jgi:hypothetical protein